MSTNNTAKGEIKIHRPVFRIAFFLKTSFLKNEVTNITIPKIIRIGEIIVTGTIKTDVIVFSISISIIIYQ